MFSKGIALVVLVLMLLVPLSVQGAELSRIRVAHFSSDAPPVNVYVNGQNVLYLAYGDVSGWIELVPGTYSVAVAPAGTSLEDAVIGPANITLRSGQWLNVAATGLLGNGSLGVSTFSEPYGALASGEARVTVFHGIPDAPAVDVILPDNTKIVSGLRYGSATTLDVPAGAYNLRVVAAGTTGPAVLDLQGVVLNAQTFYLVSALGRLATPSVGVVALNQSVVAPLFGKQLAAGTIADIVKADGRFDTLQTALELTGLDAVLDGTTNYTVFAPTDNAFAKLPAGTLETLVANPTVLADILKYHVVAGTFPASEVVKVTSFATLNGSVTVTIKDGSVFLNGNVKVTVTDIKAFNGVIHVIDTVLVPGA
jgi:uncharacterized surface protein with fasciclin (FAS1) repeats